MNELFQKVKSLLAEGKSRAEIAIILDRQKSTINYYANPTNWDKFERRDKVQTKRIEFEQGILDIIDHAHSFSEVCDLLGIKHTRTNIDRIIKFLEERNITPIWHKKLINRKPGGYWTQETIFVKDSKYKTSGLKTKLLQYGLKEARCEICQNTEWRGKPIPLQTHHINGIHTDNRLENLQLVCPNCHAQTDNYCGRNIKPSKYELKKKQKSPIDWAKDKISKDQLELELYSPDFINISTLARKLNLNRHTLQHLCKLYDLPSTTKELRKPTKEQLESIICKHCGKLFKPARKGALYCSKYCFNVDTNRSVAPMPTREEILKQSLSCNSMKELALCFDHKELRKSCRKAGLPTDIKSIQQIALTL